ncbi:MAG TPA: DUF2567 domain-containing protein [Micromonosporaceae bacterium]
MAVNGAAALVIALLGAPLGLLWAAAAPAVPLIKADKGAIAAQPEPEQFIAADGWFTLLGLGLGALVAITVWFVLRRYRGPVGMVVATVGMVGAAVVAWRLGREVGLAEFHRLLESAPAGTRLEKPPDLRAGGFVRLGGLVPLPRGVLLAPAFGAAVTYTLLAGWSRYPNLRPDARRSPVSWGWPGPQAPAAAPAPPAPGAGEPPRG